MDEPNQLDHYRLDGMLAELADAAQAMKRDQVIWTAAAIGAEIGRSEQWVRKTLAKMPGTPIRQSVDNGTLHVRRSALWSFMGKHAA